jgi:hypothetical protein
LRAGIRRDCLDCEHELPYSFFSSDQTFALPAQLQLMISVDPWFTRTTLKNQFSPSRSPAIE